MANFKHFDVSRDPIDLIKSSGVPLRLQDIAKMCQGDRRYILRCIESHKKKERLEMREYFFDNGLDFRSLGRNRSISYKINTHSAFNYSDGDTSSEYDDEDDEDFDFDDENEEDDGDSDASDGAPNETNEFPFPHNLAYLYVRKGFPLKLLKNADFDTIRKKWVVNGHWRNTFPRGYMRLFCTYRVMREIKAIPKVPLELKPKKGRLYPLIRKSR